MAALFISAENQIQRLNFLMEKIGSLQSLPIDMLTSAPNTQAWSILEIIEHLNIAYGHYVDKVSDALNRAKPIENDKEPFKARIWQGFIINGQRPKGQTRKWKMKTMKRFEPEAIDTTHGKDHLGPTFEQFQHLHGHLKEAILMGRHKNLRHMKIPSAIGSIVNFYLPEAFEFILCHAERHLVQIEETKEILSKKEL